jgi:hypothetical protein
MHTGVRLDETHDIMGSLLDAMTAIGDTMSRIEAL